MTGVVVDRVQRTAVMSLCGTYRFALGRIWSPSSPTVGFIMLNPSTADAEVDDPTIRRCVGFAQHWGYGGALVANLFALRATKPTELAVHPDPVGENDRYLVDLARQCPVVVCGWGAHPMAQSRAGVVLELLRAECPDAVMCLGVTKTGAPRHPLYIRADTQPVEYRGVL